MSKTNEEHSETERILKRVRPQEPSAELKARIMHAAQGAWQDVSANVPWQIPIGRLVASAAAAAVLISLANLYGDRASALRPTAAPTAGYVKPRDLDIMMDPHIPLARYAITAGRSARPNASSLLDYLQTVREALRETERSDASEEPAPAERRSRLLPTSPSRLS